MSILFKFQSVIEIEVLLRVYYSANINEFVGERFYMLAAAHLREGKSK